jgi:hypothetical protein
MTTPAQSVPDFIAGFGPQQGDMAVLWSDAAAFFQQRVVFRASQTTTATTLPSTGVVTQILYDNIIEDPHAGWNAGTKYWVCPAGCQGWYQVTTTLYVTGSGGPAQEIVCTYVQTPNGTGNPVNGIPLVLTVIPASPSGGEATAYVYLNAGDSVGGAGAVFNSSLNLTTDLVAGQNSTIEVIWISS